MRATTRRIVLAATLVALPCAARAEPDDGGEDGVSAAAAVGAGGQGPALYGGLEVRLDARWRGARLGLGARGVWLYGAFRRYDWRRPADALTLVRYLEVATAVGDGGRLALAAGALAPAQLASVVDGYRAALDARPHPGARVALTTATVDLRGELDDALAPTVVGGAVAVAVAPGWGVHGALVGDPGTATRGGLAADALTAIELGGNRRVVGAAARGELGGSVIGEPGLGAAAVAYARGATDRAGARWTARVDVRGGTGTVGAAFGPLYRVERLARPDAPSLAMRARAGELAGVGGGLTLGVVAAAGWLGLELRARPGLGALATVDAGVPLGRWWQAAAWLAATPRDLAGAAELRVTWAPRLYSALEAARIYRLDVMAPSPAWSATVWFGASTE